MGNHRAPSPTAAACVAAFVCVLALAAAEARAQPRAPSGPPDTRGRSPISEVRERQQREAMLRNTELLRPAKPGSTNRNFEAAAEQVREDFKRIQLLRNSVARHILSGQPLDYEFITDETEEINKRAGRLKSHLLREAAAPEKKDERPPELADAEVKDALVRMCQRIDSFTENPIFKTLDVVDVEQSAKAGRDLLDILHLSGGIRKAADRLRKTARK